MLLEASFQSLLCAATGYGLYLLNPREVPYVWTACAFGLTHGILGVIKTLTAEDVSVIKVTELSRSFMELVPLPLVNIELYLSSASSNLALGHGLFIIPLLSDLIARKLIDESEKDHVETLKELTIMGNIMSLVFLSFNETNILYGWAAMCAFIARYLACLADSMSEGSGLYINIWATTLFFYLTTVATAAISSKN